MGTIALVSEPREMRLSTRELLLPVTTFRRVFDTMPVQEVLTLPELVAALRRFELKF